MTRQIWIIIRWFKNELCKSNRVFVETENRICFCVPGVDLLKLTREDVIQICGPADGIRLFNALKGRWVILNFPTFLGYIIYLTYKKKRVWMFLGICILVVSLFEFRVVRPRLTIYVCQESQQAREQHPKHENGDAAASAFFGQCMFI